MRTLFTTFWCLINGYTLIYLRLSDRKSFQSSFFLQKEKVEIKSRTFFAANFNLNVKRPLINVLSLLSLLFSRRDGLKEFINQEFPQVTNVALVVIRKRTIVKMMTHSDKKGYENPPAGTVLDKMVTNK